MICFWCYESPFGPYTAAEDGEGVCALFFGQRPLPEDWVRRQTPLLRQTSLQMEEYCRGQRRAFCLPLSLHGTPFQQAVWAALQAIPYGQTRSYQQIAAQIGNPKACRAVGMANHRNPVGVIVPCHRVIGKNGGLTGYAGGLAVKQALLALEEANR